jgi:hypothetical protein
VLAFGEGVALPTRLKFKQLPANVIPQSQAVINVTADSAKGASEDFIDTIIDRWRGATMSHKQSGADGGSDFESLARDEFSSLSVAPQAPTVAPPPPAPTPAPAAAAPRTLDPDRFRLLKKPIEGAGTLGRNEPPAPPSWRR